MDPEVLVLVGGNKTTRTAGTPHVARSMAGSRRSTPTSLLITTSPATLLSAALWTSSLVTSLVGATTRSGGRGQSLVLATQGLIGFFPSLLQKFLLAVNNLVYILPGPQVVFPKD